MNHLDFLKESLKNLKTMGTVARSSKALCLEAVKHAQLPGAKVVVELGAGDGVLTKYILEAMGPDATLFAFEVSPVFAKLLRKIEDPRLVVCEESAENIIPVLRKAGHEQADSVISVLPIVVFPEELGERIIRTCHEVLKQGKPFVQVHYSLLKKKIYQQIFGNVELFFVAMNIPPAFLHVCLKRA